jgi:hypothetical protein
MGMTILIPKEQEVNGVITVFDGMVISVTKFVKNGHFGTTFQSSGPF